MIANKVKLVVWDLDETFWRGTLSEEEIVANHRNIEIVRTLAHRGILNSICSKNDYKQTKAKLVELDIWDFFVFPSISFDPKGKAVTGMIEAAALRAENVLFIDDNRLNLEEVKFFNPGIMIAHPDEVLDGLLDHENLAGKPDPELTRLNQYRFLQQKVEDRGASALSNEEFLRTSNILIDIDYDVEANFDRVVELINRANQLNYTKRRLNAPGDVSAFRESLSVYGTHAGVVSARDSYGDYGVIGFFLMTRLFNEKRLVHFVFSCRTMNMGIEQYVYELLDRPDVQIVEPVSYGLRNHGKIDWINASSSAAEGGMGGRRLVLLGGCDLMQLASYCSGNRLEFVNGCKDGEMIRFDDPGFILTDRSAVRDFDNVRKTPLWTYEDRIRFDDALASSQIVLVSMFQAMNMSFYKANGVLVSFRPPRVARLEEERPDWFVNGFEPLHLADPEKLSYIEQSYAAIESRTSPESKVFVLGNYSLGTEGKNRQKRRSNFNAMSDGYCMRQDSRSHFIDLDAVVPRKYLAAKVHFSPAGYHFLARYILALMDGRVPEIALAD